VAEVGVRGAGRDDEVIVEDRRAEAALLGWTRGDEDPGAGRIDFLRIAEQHFDVLLPAQDPPDRRCDVAGR
jgi:hypothetical protein